jgi:hypothetical protein
MSHSPSILLFHKSCGQGLLFLTRNRVAFPGTVSTLRRVAGMLCPCAAQGIFRDIHIRLLARLMINNLLESLAAYSSTLPEGDEIQNKEKGYRTRGSEIPSQDAFPVCPNAAILKGYVRE